jgi:hypothetical protein
MPVRTRWRSIAPILTSYEDQLDCLAQTFDFGLGVSIGPAQHWPISDEETDGFSAVDLFEVRNRRFAFIVDYADGTSVDSAWPSSKPRMNFQTAVDRIHYAILALWLTRITPLAIKFAFHHIERSPGEFGFARLPDVWDPFLCIVARAENHLQPGDLDVARSRFQVLYALGPHGSVAATIRLLMKTISDPEPISSYVLLWTCVEALFGDEESSGEIVHKLAERESLFLQGRSDTVFDTYRQIKKDYDLRSKIIHGLRTQPKHEKEFPAALSRTEDWVRLPLQKIADSTDLAATINGTGRQRFLERLPFAK